MNKPIFAVIDGVSNVFTNLSEYHNATFSPNCIIECVRRLEINGRTYAERRENLRDLAIDIQGADNGGMSYCEWEILGNFFDKNARRYGLLNEFRENGIC
jgi:hypothetical protein